MARKDSPPPPEIAGFCPLGHKVYVKDRVSPSTLISKESYFTCASCHKAFPKSELRGSSQYFWPDGGDINDPQKGAKEFHEAMKQDKEKPKMSLISPWVLEELSKVLTEGAKKYAPDNWRNSNGFTYRRLIDAALRHINSFNKGEDLDPEWGISHLAHAIACLMFLEEQRQLERGVDDRWKPEPPKIDIVEYMAKLSGGPNKE